VVLGGDIRFSIWPLVTQVDCSFSRCLADGSDRRDVLPVVLVSLEFTACPV
jgi:hypothetical protein